MSGRIGPVAGLLSLLIAGAKLAAAAPTLTTVQDTLYKADGTRFNGVAFIEWRTFEAADTSNVPTQSLTVRITEGVLRVALVPTTDAKPTAYYRVRFNADGRTEFTEYWAVPPSGTPVRLRDIRIPGPLAVSNLPVPPINTAILIPDVAGLRDELDNRPVKGPGFTAGRVTIANSEGELESVVGAVQDCVRVDGSSGACGVAKAVAATSGRVTVLNAIGELATVAGATTDCVRPDGTTGPCGVAKAATAANGRVALLNTAGELATVAGATTDCVRPDGTTGPCGVAKAATATNGRIALLNTSGELATVAGATTDCVRPDGTTGPCGLVKSSGFTTGRVTMVNAAGELASVNGATTDCVRPDGTTAPCGLAKAADFTPGRVTVVNSSGELASVAGAAGDCVRSDGGTRPCAGGVVFVDGETPGGVIDGANVTFTLASVPAPASSLLLFRNGLLLRPGLDYSLSAQTITLNTASAPAPADTLIANYRFFDPAAAGTNFIDGETPGGSVNGVNKVFTLANAPAPTTSLQVFRNGLRMKSGLDYTAAGTTLSFVDAAVPQSGDVLLVSYRF
ncbi:MAG TPA: hypothetical protein VFL57_12375 [Bryobacteraceae bacterium]|nr:hypothetical protein [Bryobacteraceae bacterium]